MEEREREPMGKREQEPMQSSNLLGSREKTWGEMSDSERIQKLIREIEYLKKREDIMTMQVDRLQRVVCSHKHINSQVCFPVDSYEINRF